MFVFHCLQNYAFTYKWTLLSPASTNTTIAYIPSIVGPIGTADVILYQMRQTGIQIPNLGSVIALLY